MKNYFIVLFCYFWLFFALIFAISSISQIYSNANFRKNNMIPVIEFIENHKASFNKIPTLVEFNSTYHSSMQVIYYPSYTDKDEYSFEIWRGEWFESYNSTSNSFNPEHSVVYFIILGAISFFIGIIPISLYYLFKRKV